jgi:hypothetical protein
MGKVRPPLLMSACFVVVGMMVDDWETLLQYGIFFEAAVCGGCAACPAGVGGGNCGGRLYRSRGKRVQRKDTGMGGSGAWGGPPFPGKAEKSGYVPGVMIWEKPGGFLTFSFKYCFKLNINYL